MADAEAPEAVQAPEAGEPAADKAPKRSKPKKKKKHRLRTLLLFIILLGGVGVGLQMSGSVDLRPYVYEIVPKLPLVGESLSSAIGVPEIYTLSAPERRRRELDEWERSLADKKRSLDELDAELSSLSDDLYLRSGQIDSIRNDLMAKLEELNADPSKGKKGSSGASAEDEMAEVIGTFGEMSPKTAAAILEKMPPDMAVEVLNGLDGNMRARVLAKMEATRAADLIERSSEAME